MQRRIKVDQIVNTFSVSAVLFAAVFSFSRPAQADGDASVTDLLPETIAPIQAPFEMPQLKRPVFPDRTFNIKDFGAVEGGKVKITDAIKKTIEAAAKAGGGKVVIPEGIWLTGPIHLKSNINLYAAKDAEVRFSSDFKDYLPGVFSRHNGVECYKPSALIYANGCENIAITGKGIFHGYGKDWRRNASMILKPAGGRPAELVADNVPVKDRLFEGSEGDYLRPAFVQPINCTNVFIEGVTFMYGPQWTIQPTYCENVIVRGVRVVTKGTEKYDGTPNGDGVNPDSCKNVLIEYCDMDTGDDCFAIKSGRAEDGLRVGKPSENIVIRHSQGRRGHGGVVIGSETSGGIRNVFIRDCTFDGTDRGLRFKTARGRGASIENIWARDIKMGTIRREAIIVNTLRYTKRYPAYPLSDRTPTYGNLNFRNITCEYSGKTAIRLVGLPEKPMEGLNFENITIKGATGIRAQDAGNVKFTNVHIVPDSGPVVLLDECFDITIDNSKRPDSAEPFVQLVGKKTKNIKMDGVDITEMKTERHNSAAATKPRPRAEVVAEWTFDKVNSMDAVTGKAHLVDGVAGKALKCDGYTTWTQRDMSETAELNDGFTVEAWIAPQTYSWNWTAIINQEENHEKGFFFGIDLFGHISLQMALGGEWVECTSEKTIPLLEWSHIAANYIPRGGIRLFINGEPAGEIANPSAFTSASNREVWVGRSQTNMSPRSCERKASREIKSPMVFDGLIDEVRIYNRPLSEQEISAAYIEKTPRNRQPLKFRQIPTGPTGPAPFGAHYCKLDYAPAWDNLWRGELKSDILVRFDMLPVKYMFWRGTSYGGTWITENNNLMGDQSIERVGKGHSPLGCSEHMSDKQCRYGSVRIVENNEARVVITWRYAISDIGYNIFGQDPVTGWGEWAEETYYIYPDGVATRKQVLWSDHLRHEWQETIPIMHPGQRPEDILEDEALVIANIKGDTQRFSWIDKKEFNVLVEDPVIRLVNMRSEYDPFLILVPGSGIVVKGGNRFEKQGTHYKWWNHWPVAQLPSDGTRAYTPDRPSHTHLAQSMEYSQSIEHDEERGTFTAVHLTGMTNKPIEALLPLAKSWITPPELKLTSPGFESDGYNKYQRAYVLHRVADDARDISVTVNASEDSPVVNPVFVINGWQGRNVRVIVNGQTIKRGDQYRIGNVRDINGDSTLILMVMTSQTSPVAIELHNSDSGRRSG